MAVPAGAFLVEGTSAQDLPYEREYEERVPAKFGDGEPVKLAGPPGPLTLMVKELPSEWAPAADGFKFTFAMGG